MRALSPRSKAAQLGKARERERGGSFGAVRFVTAHGCDGVWGGFSSLFARTCVRLHANMFLASQRTAALRSVQLCCFVRGDRTVYVSPTLTLPPHCRAGLLCRACCLGFAKKKAQKHTSVSISKARTIIQATRTLSAQPRFETQLASCAQCSCVCMLHMYCRQAQHIVCWSVAKHKRI